MLFVPIVDPHGSVKYVVFAFTLIVWNACCSCCFGDYGPNKSPLQILQRICSAALHLCFLLFHVFEGTVLCVRHMNTNCTIYTIYTIYTKQHGTRYRHFWVDAYQPEAYTWSEIYVILCLLLNFVYTLFFLSISDSDCRKIHLTASLLLVLLVVGLVTLSHGETDEYLWFFCQLNFGTQIGVAVCVIGMYCIYCCCILLWILWNRLQKLKPHQKINMLITL